MHIDFSDPAAAPTAPTDADNSIEGSPETELESDASGRPGLTAGQSAAIASASWLVPLAMSIGANPSPTNPGIFAWYLALKKPGFKPPDAAIPVAWTVIEAALAASAYRLLRAPADPHRTRALGLWAFNVGMIGGWSRLFFRRRNLPLSTAAAAAMVATGTAFVAEARRVDRPAAGAGLPFVGWVAFATVLTASIWALNRR